MKVLEDHVGYRIISTLKDLSIDNYGDYFKDTLDQIPLKWMSKFGTFKGKNGYQHPAIDHFLSCDINDSLNFIQMFFELSKCIKVIKNGPDSINQILLEENVPFQFTQYQVNWSIYYNDGPEINQYPKFISNDDNYSIQTTKTALSLLIGFQKANEEFESALMAFRDSQYDVCITNCSSAIESLVKNICFNREWDAPSSSEMKPLLDVLKDHKFFAEDESVNSIYTKVILGSAISRNSFGNAHGRQEVEFKPSKIHAQYALNLAASNIIFLASL